jgi:hypothetical protein
VNRIVWLVTGNKGGGGKSVVAKGLADWLEGKSVPLMVTDGDLHTQDVRADLGSLLPINKIDLSHAAGWKEYGDFLGQSNFQGHVVTNLPNALSHWLGGSIKALSKLGRGLGFQVKVLVVINTLPDGLRLLDAFTEILHNTYIVKNLHFGTAHDFGAFDSCTSAQNFEGRVILFPGMNPRTMMVVRTERMSFKAFLAQTGNSRSNTIYAKIVVAHWREAMHEAFENVLQEAK